MKQNSRLAFLLMVLAGCAPMHSSPQTDAPAGSVRLTAARLASGAVLLTLHNGSADAVGYNLCPAALQRRDNSGWSPIESDEVCTMQLITLEPGAEATFEKRLPAGLPSGEYRYVASVESPLGTAQEPVISQPFTLNEPVAYP